MYNHNTVLFNVLFPSEPQGHKLQYYYRLKCAVISVHFNALFNTKDYKYSIFFLIKVGVFFSCNRKHTFLSHVFKTVLLLLLSSSLLFFLTTLVRIYIHLLAINPLSRQTVVWSGRSFHRLTNGCNYQASETFLFFHLIITLDFLKPLVV